MPGFGQLTDAVKHNVQLTAVSKSNFTTLTLSTLSEPHAKSRIID